MPQVGWRLDGDGHAATFSASDAFESILELFAGAAEGLERLGIGGPVAALMRLDQTVGELGRGRRCSSAASRSRISGSST